MKRDLANRLTCVVCGMETTRHTGWFLVIDNRWLDRLKIFAWHPVLSRDGRMQSVCGKQHLKTLLAHWLAHANLQFVATGSTPWTVGVDAREAGADYVAVSLGEAVAELAVHRESLSRVWTGSPEALECILSALLGGRESQPLAPPLAQGPPLLNSAMGYFPEYVLHEDRA